MEGKEEKDGYADERTPLKINSGSQQSEAKITLYLLFVCLIATLATFNYGYHIGVINIPKDTVTNCTEGYNSTYEGVLGLPPCFTIEKGLWGTIVGLFAIGGLVGGAIGGLFVNAVGRIWTIAITDLFFIAGSLLLGFSPSAIVLGIGRVVVGIASGISTVVVPLYLSEISPISYRGAIGVLTQLSITMGILFSQILGIYMSTVPLWRWLFGMTVFIAIGQLIFLPFLVNSPRWLVSKNRIEDARRSLQHLRGKPAEVYEVEGELEAIVEGQLSTREEASYFDLLAIKKLRSPLLIAIFLQLIQQFSGINVVFYYSSDLFKESAPGQEATLTAGIGALNVALTLVSLFLMDRAGRKILLLFGQIGMTIMGVLFTISLVENIGDLGVFSCFALVFCFAIGVGPIPWLIVGEIFPTSAVAKAASIAIPVNWLANYLVGQFFPIMADGLGNYAFLPFVGFLTISVFITLKFVPETKGKSLEETSKWFE